MMLLHSPSRILMTSVVFGALTIGGCGQSGTTPPADQKSTATASADHSGWWCAEHGVPEEECSICNTKAAAGFKAKGDWCEEHNRAESQCFVCDPKRAEKYAALYEAKVGKKPPKRSDLR